jgi:putative MATE family efflux protein
MQSARSLTEGSISHRLFEFSLPILLGNVLQSLNGSVNSFWVGKYLGEAALTATANSNTILFLLLSAVFGASMAATILVGQYVGAKRLHDAKRVVGTGVSFSVLISLAMSALGFMLARPLLSAMSTPPDALALAVIYMRVIFLALPFLCMVIFIMSILRGAGDAKTPLYFMVLSVGLDILLNPILIFGVGPLPGLGIMGSSLATLIAQAVSLVSLVAYLYRRNHTLLLHGEELTLLKMDWRIVGTLIAKGVPMALQMVVMSFSMVLMITLVNRFGIDTAAAFGAAMQIWSYVQMPAFAINMAVSSMAAQNVGAQKWDRVASVTRVGLLFNLILTGALITLIQVFARFAMGLFLPAHSPALDIAVHMNHIASWSFLFFALSVVYFGVVRATGAVIAPLLILAFSLLLVRFPVAYFLLDTLQSDAIWWSFPISSMLALILASLYYKYGKWRQYRMIAPAAAGAAAATPLE